MADMEPRTAIQLINDQTGWTATWECPGDGEVASVGVPYIDVKNGGFGRVLYWLSGERNAQGMPIFRTRRQ